MNLSIVDSLGFSNPIEKQSALLMLLSSEHGSSHDRAILRMARDETLRRFECFAADRGYLCHEAGPLIPKSDSTVLFTGAAISTLKPYLYGRLSSKTDFSIVQQCLRTHNIRHLHDGTPLRWLSYFKTFGTFCQHRTIETVCSDTWKLFTDAFGIPPKNLRIRLSSTDRDLMRFWEYAGLRDRLEVDANPISYYRHRFGIPGVWGRHLNIAVRRDDREFLADVGNIIVIENAQGQLAIETAFGVETFVSRLAGYSSPVEAALISDIVRPISQCTIKLADTLGAVVGMLHGGVQPKATSRGRVLRRYLQALAPLAEHSGVTLDVIKEYAARFERLHFDRETRFPDLIATYLECFRALLREDRSHYGDPPCGAGGQLSGIFSKALN